MKNLKPESVFVDSFNNNKEDNSKENDREDKDKQT